MTNFTPMPPLNLGDVVVVQPRDRRRKTKRMVITAIAVVGEQARRLSVADRRKLGLKSEAKPPVPDKEARGL